MEGPLDEIGNSLVLGIKTAGAMQSPCSLRHPAERRTHQSKGPHLVARRCFLQTILMARRTPQRRTSSKLPALGRAQVTRIRLLATWCPVAPPHLQSFCPQRPANLMEVAAQMSSRHLRASCEGGAAESKRQTRRPQMLIARQEWPLDTTSLETVSRLVPLMVDSVLLAMQRP